VQLKSIFKVTPVLKEIRLESLTFTWYDRCQHLQLFGYHRENQGGICGRPEEKIFKPFLFLVNNIQIVDGHIEFERSPVSTQHAITQINLTVPFISDLPAFSESYVEPSLSAVVNGSHEL